MQIQMTALASVVPDRVVTNEELAASVDTSDEWIRSHTGIRERRIVAEGEAASDLAIAAARRALEQRGIGAADIDLIVVSSSSPDYANFPAVASIVQDRIGATEAGAFDLAAGCTGFVYALEVARSMVGSGFARRVLAISAEVLSRITNWSDRNTCVLFGDGAGAAIVEPAADDAADDAPVGHGATGTGRANGHPILRSWLRSKGSGDTALIRPVGGGRTPFDPTRHSPADMQIHMDGRSVYLFAVDALVRSVQALCAAEGIEPTDLDWIVPHQANLRIIDAAAKRLSLPTDRFFTNLDRYANTSSASIPIALDELQQTDNLTPGQYVATVGFGAGLSYGGNLLRW